MRKIFEGIGLLALLLVSFIYTEKTMTVIKENDEVMVHLKSVADSYYIKPIEAIINEDEFIPGINGRKVDINKSYDKMKQIGSFTESLLVFEDVKPENTISKNVDKYITSGNKEKNMISLLFLIYEDSDVNSLINILNKRNTKATLFIDGMWLEHNNERINEISKNYEIGNLSYDGNYTDPSFPWVDIVIKNVINQGYSYCLMQEKNKDYLDVCKINNNVTIYPSIYIKSNGLATLKQNIKSGNLIAIEVNDNVLGELNSMISYIESKGYTISSLKEHLQE